MTDQLFSVKDQIVLVSGGSRGIGLAIGQAFAERGATVVLTGRGQDALDAACEGTIMTGVTCDVADANSITDCVARVIEDHGRIDTMINCAGVNKRMPAEDYTAEEFDQIIAINLRGAFLMAQAVGRQMIKQGSGNIINIDSLSTHGPLTQVLPYAMSKMGLQNMTKGLALEWGPKGVRVNGLAPGFIWTDLTAKLWSDENLQAWNSKVTPMGRMGQVDDLVGTALFLASPAAGFVTGQTIRVDGGASAGMRWPIAGDFRVEVV